MLPREFKYQDNDCPLYQGNSLNYEHTAEGNLSEIEVIM